MKKVINSFIYVLIFIIIAFSLFGCGKKETPPHTHFYVKTIVEPTCQQEGYTVYKCSCGDSYIADKVDKVEHSIGSNKCKWCSVNYFQSLADWVIENRTKKVEIEAEDYGVDIEKLDEINKYHYFYNFKKDMPQALIRYTPVANLFYVAIKYVYDIDDEFLGKDTITVFRFNRFDYTYTWQTSINTGDSDNPIAMIGSLNCNTFENKNATITVYKATSALQEKAWDVQNHVARCSINYLDTLIVELRNFLTEKKIEIEGYEGHYISLRHFNLNRIEERESDYELGDLETATDIIGNID